MDKPSFFARLSVRGGDPLLTKLRNVLLYFLSKKRLNRTEVVKYLYMYEWYHRIHLGKPGIEANFIRWHYGPYAQAIASELDTLSAFGRIRCDTYVNAHGKPAYIYTTEVKPNGLTDDELEIADYVLESMHGHNYQAMIEKVYSTPPMLEILEVEEMLGDRIEGTELNMDRVNGTFKRTAAGRDAARRRLLQMSPRGSDEEYSRVIVEEYRTLEQLRRRATIVTDNPRSK
jgi:hypothetical protein